MALYITRNGQQLGPYSLAEVQAQVRTGNVVMTDLAWQEGLPNWVPLNQIPGFVYVPPPAPAVPVATTTIEESHRPRPENKSLLQKIGGGAIAIVVVLFKLAAPFLVLLKTGGSMLLSIITYCFYFNWTWQLATAIVVLIFIHEMGHVIAAKCLGVPVTAPLFIPLFGAFIAMKQNPRDAWTEAVMAYGGPLAGCIGSWICWALALQLQVSWLMHAALISFAINLFNMIPIPPLDGGRICAAVSSWFWLIGLTLLGAYTWFVFFHAARSTSKIIFIVILGVILLAAIPRLKATLFGQLTEEMQQYYRVHFTDRLTMALMYLGLIAALLLGFWHSSQYLG